MKLVINTISSSSIIGKKVLLISHVCPPKSKFHGVGSALLTPSLQTPMFFPKRKNGVSIKRCWKTTSGPRAMQVLRFKQNHYYQVLLLSIRSFFPLEHETPMFLILCQFSSRHFCKFIHLPFFLLLSLTPPCLSELHPPNVTKNKEKIIKETNKQKEIQEK